MTPEDIKLIYSCTGYAFVLSQSKHDAEDMIQTILLRILTNPVKFESLNQVEKNKYIVTAIQNQIKDKRRHAKGKVNYSVPIDITNAAIMPDVYAKIQLKEVMENGRPHEHFKTLMMNVHGYKCYEIAREKNMSINTVLGRCRYARKFLKRIA